MENKYITKNYEFSEKQKEYFRIKRVTEIFLSGMREYHD